jgi:hypothetical protein
LIGNDIPALPTWMCQLTSLTQVTLSNSPRLTSLQPLNGYPSLAVLIADNCPINAIPLNLPKLETIHLSNKNLIYPHPLSNNRLLKIKNRDDESSPRVLLISMAAIVATVVTEQ